MILIIVQARMLSTRLPGKVMKEVCGKPLIGHLLHRLNSSQKANQVLVATSVDASNDPLCDYVESIDYPVFRGSEKNVLERYYLAAKSFSPDVVVRITADCPLIDYKVVDDVIQFYLDHDFDYVSNVEPRTYPDGMDTEVFSFAALEQAFHNARDDYDREHVTPYIRTSGLFKIGALMHKKDLSKERWTVDYEEDFKIVSQIMKDLSKDGSYFDMDDILKYKEHHPELFKINEHFIV